MLSRRSSLLSSTSCPPKQRESLSYMKQRERKALGNSQRREEREREDEREYGSLLGSGDKCEEERQTEQTTCCAALCDGEGERERERGRRRQIETYHRFETSFITPPRSSLPPSFLPPSAQHGSLESRQNVNETRDNNSSRV